MRCRSAVRGAGIIRASGDAEASKVPSYTKVDYEGTKVDTNEGTKVRRYVFCDDCVRTNETRSTPVAGNLPS